MLQVEPVLGVTGEICDEIQADGINLRWRIRSARRCRCVMARYPHLAVPGPRSTQRADLPDNKPSTEVDPIEEPVGAAEHNTGLNAEEGLWLRRSWAGRD